MPNHKLQITNGSRVWFLIFLPLLFTTYYLLPTTPAHAQEVDLLWQGDVYVPPFYEGRTLWSNQSEVIILAIPHISSQGRELDPSALTYKWWKDSVVLNTVSGVGKNSISITDSITGRPQEIKVEVMTSNGAVLASASKKLSGLPVKILVYENSPLYGLLFNHEVGTLYEVRERETTLAAIPLFFSSFEKDPGFINFKWNTSSGDTEGSGSVTYRFPEGATGSARIRVKASNENRFMQFSEKSFTLDVKNDQ